MQNFKILLIFLFGITLGAFIWGVSLIFLNKTPVFYLKIKKDYFFYPIDLTNIFFNSQPIITKRNILSLKGIKLKAVYFNGKTGFIIIEEKGKIYFVDLGKYYNGYKLIKIGETYAIFEKNAKVYKVQMEKAKINNTFFAQNNNELQNRIVVSKNIFDKYVKNFNKIWQNIGILKTKKGYMITYIKPHSIFKKIGLKRGDIILEVNGRKLKNDSDAWNLYKNATKFNYFEIKILRNNKERVLYYEVD